MPVCPLRSSSAPTTPYKTANVAYTELDLSHRDPAIHLRLPSASPSPPPSPVARSYMLPPATRIPATLAGRPLAHHISPKPPQPSPVLTRSPRQQSPAPTKPSRRPTAPPQALPPLGCSSTQPSTQAKPATLPTSLQAISCSSTRTTVMERIPSPCLLPARTSSRIPSAESRPKGPAPSLSAEF